MLDFEVKSQIAPEILSDCLCIDDFSSSSV